MAAAPIPPPNASGDPQQGNAGPGGGFPSPAPAQSDPQAAELMRAMIGVVATIRTVASKVPTAAGEAQQINELVAKIIGKIKGGGQASESQAPPV